MASTDADIAEFQRHRPKLMGIAYRMLGSMHDAEEVLQDAWLRWQPQDRSAIESSEAWLVTATTRLALDRLRRARTEREHYVGPWLPEPLPEEEAQVTPHALAERADDLSLSFMLLLERLNPDERAAFLLHDVFDLDYPRIAAMLEQTEATCRQRVHRARQKLREDRTRRKVDQQTVARLLERFARALAEPTDEVLGQLLAEDAMLFSDGGGIRRAALRPLYGRERLTRMYKQLALLRRLEDWRVETLHGESVLVVNEGGKLGWIAWIHTDGERILAIHSVVNPEKLSRPIFVTNRDSRAS
jgi:RNA polymerase sigma factor (sigma-70 family)